MSTMWAGPQWRSGSTENLTTQEARHTNSCYFTMVARKEDGSPCIVPPLRIESETERRLFEAGKMRKEMRKEIMERNTALHVGPSGYRQLKSSTGSELRLIPLPVDKQDLAHMRGRFHHFVR